MSYDGVIMNAVRGRHGIGGKGGGVAWHGVECLFLLSRALVLVCVREGV